MSGLPTKRPTEDSQAYRNRNPQSGTSRNFGRSLLRKASYRTIQNDAEWANRRVNQQVCRIASAISSSPSGESRVRSPCHHIATTFSLGTLVSEIGRDHILHGDAHSLLHRNLGIAKPAPPPTKLHCPNSRSRAGVHAPYLPPPP